MYRGNTGIGASATMDPLEENKQGEKIEILYRKSSSVFPLERLLGNKIAMGWP